MKLQIEQSIKFKN